jgi:LCP family protein required for cell wall assembly
VLGKVVSQEIPASMVAALTRPGTATPGSGRNLPVASMGMAPARDEDLDWLYGRDRSPAAEPEHTRVMPSDPSSPRREDRSRQGAPGSTAVHPAGPPVAPADRRQPAAGQGYRPAPVIPAEPGGPGGPGGPGTPPGDQPADPGGRPAKKRHPVRNSFRVLALLLLVFVVGLVGIPAYAWSHVSRVHEAPAGDRPANQPGTTFLLVGSDSREGLTKAERKTLGTGDAAGQRTDTIMVLYIPPGGKPALISIPRDSYVAIPHHGKNKINAAYAFGGPKLLVQTVEQDTGLRVDAYLEIGLGGFVNVIDSVGGIEMCLPKAIKDKDSHIDLPKGCQTLNGANALGYVRMRHADPLGDLGRVQRQRAMLAAVAKKGASAGTVLNPFRYWALSNATADALKLGEQTSFANMVSLGLAMRKVSGDQGLNLTVPVSDTSASTPAGSAVLWDDDQAKKMFADIARGDTSGLAKYAK